jgi:Protein of unknown function (DUF1257)
MSHFSQLKTQLNDKEILKKALTHLGFTIVEEENTQVRGFFGDTISAEFKVLTSTHYDIGFVRDESGNYQIVGDWELLPKVSDITQEEFSRRLKRAYAKTAIEEVAKAQGWDLQSVENDNGDTVEMVVTQW